MKVTLFVIFSILCIGLIRADVAEDVRKSMDESVDPCDDFYKFSCGGWLKDNDIPDDKNRIDRAFGNIDAENEKVLLEIAKDPSTGIVNTLFRSCMDTETIDSLRYKQIEPLITQINRGVKSGSVSQLWYLVGSLQKYGVRAFYSFFPEIDAKDPKVMLAGLYQGGLSLPNEDYYLSDDYKEIRGDYETHISNSFKLLGHKEDEAKRSARQVLDMETAIAGITTPYEDLIDPEKSFNKVGFEGLMELSRLPWDHWRNSVGRKDIVEIAIDSVDFFSDLHSVVTENEDKWESYLLWHLMNRFANLLHKEVREENFSFFGKRLNGLQVMEPRERTCIKLTDSNLGELVGIHFSRRKFPQESKDLAKKMIENIEEAFDDMLDELEWMDDDTRSRAKIKADKISHMIGYPDDPKNYTSPIHIKTFAANIMNLRSASFFEGVRSIQKPTVAKVWQLSPATVNAYYDPTRNQIVFPAGILQKPFFNVDYPPAMNHGGIGMVVGHEITHGFDNQGSRYDGNGKLENWWEDETSEEFQRKVDCVIDQYSKYEVLPGHYINGNLTQGENIADMGGIKATYYSYIDKYNDIVDEDSILKGYTNRELFFISFAQTWCSKWTDELMKIRLLTDPHSPPEFRIIGSLSNFKEFSSTFQCKEGSRMNPVNKCDVW